MTRLIRILLAGLLGVALFGGILIAAPGSTPRALGCGDLPCPTATPPPPTPKPKCNSGNGNGQETTVENDCDPGNSGGRNNGGG